MTAYRLPVKLPGQGGPVCGADYAVTGGLVDLRIDDFMDFNAIWNKMKAPNGLCYGS